MRLESRLRGWSLIGILAGFGWAGFCLQAEDRPATGTTSPAEAGGRFLAGKTVEFVPGTLPIVIAAPHGGRLAPPEIPDREEGVLRSDSNTDLLASQIAEAIQEITGEKPHLVICHLKRIKVDCNRDLFTGTAGNPGAERTWRAFHQAIGEAREAGAWIFLDVHGHSHPEQNIELGYLLTTEQLKKTGGDLDALEARTSIAHWSETSPDSFAERLRGKSSLGGQLEKRGFPSVPSPTQPHAGEAKYFSGGYNTARYGSVGEDRETVSIQVETPFPGVRDHLANRRKFALALAESLVVSLERHAALELPSGRDEIESSSGGQ